MIGRIALIVLTLALAPAPALADPDADVVARQDLFRQMQTSLARLDGIARSSDPDKSRDDLKEAAKDMAMISTQPWQLFGRETTIARRPSHASALIWSDPAGFRAAGSKLSEEAQKLNVAAAKINADDLKKSMAELNAACDACHRDYRN